MQRLEATLRLLSGIGLFWTALILALVACTTVEYRAVSEPAPTSGPPVAPTPNPHPRWLYYDSGPFDDSAYTTVTVAEIVQNPFAHNGRLIRVRGQYQPHGPGIVAPCIFMQSKPAPVVRTGFARAGGMTSLRDAGHALDLGIRQKDGQQELMLVDLSTARGDQIELRGILRAFLTIPRCPNDDRYPTAYLAIQRNDPSIPFTESSDALAQRTVLAPVPPLQRGEPNPRKVRPATAAETGPLSRSALLTPRPTAGS
jgi:hypothetical protein